jgi:hypothetical protein
MRRMTPERRKEHLPQSSPSSGQAHGDLQRSFDAILRGLYVDHHAQELEIVSQRGGCKFGVGMDANGVYLKAGDSVRNELADSTGPQP